MTALGKGQTYLSEDTAARTLAQVIHLCNARFGKLHAGQSDCMSPAENFKAGRHGSQSKG
jgi:hypothetical protein